jgi:type II secretory pathway component PulF
MPVYKWEGKTLKGVIKKGESEAPNESAIRTHLRQQNIVPTKIVAKGKDSNSHFPLERRWATVPLPSLLGSWPR